jgi:hypothetical protein
MAPAAVELLAGSDVVVKQLVGSPSQGVVDVQVV